MYNLVYSKWYIDWYNIATVYTGISDYSWDGYSWNNQ